MAPSIGITPWSTLLWDFMGAKRIRMQHWGSHERDRSVGNITGCVLGLPLKLRGGGTVEGKGTFGQGKFIEGCWTSRRFYNRYNLLFDMWIHFMNAFNNSLHELSPDQIHHSLIFPFWTKLVVEKIVRLKKHSLFLHTFACLHRFILIHLGWKLLNVTCLPWLHCFMLIHPWMSLRDIFLLNRIYVLNLLIYFGRQFLLQPLKK